MVRPKRKGIPLVKRTPHVGTEFLFLKTPSYSSYNILLFVFLGMEFDSCEQHGQMGPSSWLSVRSDQVGATRTDSPLKGKRELCGGMLTAHGWGPLFMEPLSFTPKPIVPILSQSLNAKPLLSSVTHISLLSYSTARPSWLTEPNPISVKLSKLNSFPLYKSMYWLGKVDMVMQVNGGMQIL